MSKGPGAAVSNVPDGNRPKVQEVTRSVSRLLARMIREQGFGEAELPGSDLIVGSHYGRVEFIVKGGEQANQLGYADYCGPNFFTHSISSAITGQASIDHRISGETVTINTGDLSGLDAIGYCHLVAGVKPGLLFAGGADSAFAIEASGYKRGDALPGGGAGLFALCNEGYAALHNRKPIAYILDYSSGLEPGYIEEGFEGLLREALSSPLFAEKEKILLLILGDHPVKTPGPEFAPGKRIRYIAPGDDMGEGGAATGPVVLAGLLDKAPPAAFGELLDAVSIGDYDLVFLAGYESSGKYTHLAVGV